MIKKNADWTKSLPPKSSDKGKTYVQVSNNFKNENNHECNLGRPLLGIRCFRSLDLSLIVKETIGDCET